MGKIFDPIKENVANLFSRRIAPQIMAKYAGMDATSSSGARDALMRAGTDLSLGMGATLAPMAMQQRSQNLGAMGMIPQMGQAMMDPAQRQILSGGVSQAYEDERLRANEAQYRESQIYGSPYLPGASSLMGMPLTNQVVSTRAGGLGSTLLGGLASGAGAALGGMATGGMGGLASMAGGLASGARNMFGGGQQQTSPGYSYDNPYAWDRTRYAGL